MKRLKSLMQSAKKIIKTKGKAPESEWGNWYKDGFMAAGAGVKKEECPVKGKARSKWMVGWEAYHCL